jgi:hypothetical protein
MNKTTFGEAETGKEFEKLKRVFMKMFKEIQNKEFDFTLGLQKRKGYYIDMNYNSKVKSVMIIEEEKIEEYKNWWANNKNAVGFSVLATNYGEEEVRIGCFGLSHNLMQKALSKSTKRTLSYRLAKRSRK